MQRSTLTRITADPVVDWSPTWTSDGKHLVFSRREGAASNVYRQSADGTGVAERLTTGYQTFVPGSMTTDGAYLIGHSSVPSSWTLFRLPLLKGGAVEPFRYRSLEAGFSRQSRRTIASVPMQATRAESGKRLCPTLRGCERRIVAGVDGRGQ